MITLILLAPSLSISTSGSTVFILRTQCTMCLHSKFLSSWLLGQMSAKYMSNEKPKVELYI